MAERGANFCHFTGFSTALKELFLTLYYMLLFRADLGQKETPHPIGLGRGELAASR
ncbi:hypothetical protein J8246_09580 [Corynebacterium tuberculostearicum]|uniref:hypothetical protein n=1 Tax=Corynebacterium TaxID=1716 RepID=UPI001EF24753|nr:MULTISPECIES: hypothetical protein [Corynebacterium]MCG7465663.1 hypothetical protein [Corynebacterium sp. ACRPJ]MDV2428020.1 hypothetical protein [Corynebacterium tuberculostearicum]WKE52624.1 hypothetical protein J8246_09580 [Corynebacterium tuberculostearicum]